MLHAALLLLPLSLPSSAAVKVAFLGDMGIKRPARQVLELVKGEGAELLLVQGDFDYEDDPPAWDKMLTDLLGSDYPVLASLGNHDVKKKDGYQKLLKAREKRAGLSCTGDTAVKQKCRYKDLTLVFTAPDVAGKDHADYIRSAFKDDDAPWRVCSFHKNMRAMQVEGKTDDTGWDVYEACLEAGAIVATGHAHNYSRTHLMHSFEKQKVAATANTLRLSPGFSFAFVSGLGGLSIRSQKLKGDWWAVIHTKDQGAKPGALFCTFGVEDDARRALCYFKDIGGSVPDTFGMVTEIGLDTVAASDDAGTSGEAE